MESDKPVFVNVYQPLPTGITILAEKVLEGRPLNAGEFTFHLLKDGLFWAEAHNGADGIIRFPVTFTEEGTYNFVIQEQVPEKTLHGVTYNTTAYPVSTIVVTDENGQLKATVNDNAVDNTNVGSGAVIVNKYVAADTTVTVKAFKAMIGRELNDSEFTFYLKDAGGKTVATGTNDAEGHITFDTITYKHGDLLGQESRVFTYTLSEEAGTLPGVSYDTTTHTVEVTLRDDLHGQLHAQVAYSGELLFTNTYTPADTTLVLEAAKKLFGRQLAEGEFTFELLNDQGQQLATATNKADGSVRFDAISFYEAGQYTFTLKEIPGSDEDIRYDENSYTVTVNVSDEDGQLVATASYPKGGVVFKNTYTPPVVPGNPVTGDETPVMLLAFMLAASSTALLTMAVQRLRKRKTQA